MKKRGWEFMGHGNTNSTNLAGLNPDQERDTIRGILKTIEQATGKRPRGWLGSRLIETHSTLDILAEECRARAAYGAKSHTPGHRGAERAR